MPQNGLIKGIIYTKDMVGMRPEVVPLVAHLNQYFHKSVDLHVNLTAHFLDKHKSKVSKRTTNNQLTAYRKIRDPNLGHNAGASSHKRIKEDIKRIVNETYRKIFDRRSRFLDTTAYTGLREVE